MKKVDTVTKVPKTTKVAPVTREINTNPNSGQIQVKITGDVLTFGYGCNIGEVYTFNRAIAQRIIENKLGVEV